VVIMLISLAAALLPLADGYSGAPVIGTMMVAAGFIETIAGALRLRNRFVAMLPGAITIVAGLLFAMEPFDAFVPTVRLVIGWLAARGVVLVLASLEARGSVRLWTVLAGITDLSLSAIVLIGLSATTITLAFFGPTNEIVSSFAWVLALSFVATGGLLLEVAACEGPDTLRN
jgi:uncharacterized membrane protein HdeD (DUF308 family)